MKKKEIIIQHENHIFARCCRRRHHPSPSSWCFITIIIRIVGRQEGGKKNKQTNKQANRNVISKWRLRTQTKFENWGGGERKVVRSGYMISRTERIRSVRSWKKQARAEPSQAKASERRKVSRTRAGQPFLPRLIIPTFLAVHSSLFSYAHWVRVMVYIVYSCPKPSVSLWAPRNKKSANRPLSPGRNKDKKRNALNSEPQLPL